MPDERYPHLSDSTLAAVDWFADQMKRKLEDNHHKGQRETWLQNDVDQLTYRIREEAEELETAGMVFEADSRSSRHLENAQNVIDEAADVSNMAMMAADCVRAEVEH